MKILSLFPAFFSVLSSGSQNLDSIIASKLEDLATIQAQYPTEKVYLTLDKELFSTLDNIWFTAYAFDAQTHQPGVESRVLYVELVDQEGVITERVIKIENGTGHGNLPIPDNLKSGWYRVRAYTNFMRNFPQELFFRKDVQVVNVREENIVAKIQAPYEPEIKLSVEGGQLVQNLVNQVVAVGPSSIKTAKLLENDNDAIYTVHFSHGVGKFPLIPESGKKYTLVVDNEEEVSLPEIKERGTVLTVRQNDQNVFISVQGSSPVSGFLVGHNRGNVFIVSKAKKDEEFIFTTIAKSELSDGLQEFIYFDQDGAIENRRIFFVESDRRHTKLDLSLSKMEYGTRSEADVLLEMKGKKSPAGVFSISVQDMAQPSTTPQNLKNYLLLSSDLNSINDGMLRYYNTNQDNNQVLNNFLISSSLSRMPELSVELEDKGLTFSHELGFSVRGKTTKYYNRKKPVRASLDLTFLENPLFKETVQSNKEGYFEFGPLDIAHELTAVLQASFPASAAARNKINNDRIRIELIERDVPAILPFSKLIEDPSGEEISRFIEKSKIIHKVDSAFDFSNMIMLDPVEIASGPKPFEKPNYRQGQLYFKPDHQVIMDSLPNLNTALSIYDVFRRTPGLQVIGAYPNETVLIRGRNRFNESEEPLVLLDNNIVDFDALLSLAIQDIHHIDLLLGTKAVIYGSRGGNGVIAVHSRRGQGRKDWERVGIVNFIHPGYHENDPFPMPDYRDRSLSFAKPDRRTTLFWNPQVELIKKQETEISFYTSDDKGQFQVKVEGMTSTGDIISKTAYFHVK
ncbi:MAG: TonB-dependent receptor plug domain-containing protein [Cyclobacteriaceae bacterium]|nr:TonB-dependent receptor plug domain-containing protein [Cyclobacteriaceae bacterium HetDA_MAG_MS6]